jgi:DNA-binding MarR family transcriptional regulator
VIEVLLALTLLEAKDLELEIRTEDKVDLSIPKIWRKQPTPSREEITVLRVLSESRDVSLSDMAKRLRVSPATMHRILRRMEEEEFIVTKKIGREKIAELTLKGEVFLKLFLEKKELRRE